jgi:hypothetical protein
MCGKEVRKEKEFQDSKDNEELNDNNSPELFAQSHMSESVGVQVVGPI